MSNSDVLVVGAGPTGLVLALWLHKMGVHVRVIDQAEEPGTTSRALAVQARTLELYRALGIDAPAIDGGVKIEALHFWVRGEEKARVPIAAIGAGLSPYPYVLVYPQDAHEKLLTERLEAAGVRVERPVSLAGFEQSAERVVARLRRADGTVETCEAAYLAGCDGARSAVRAGLDLGFPGGTYEHMFYVADVDARGPTVDGELHLGLDDEHFVLCFPLKSGRVRLIGAVRDDIGGAGKDRQIAWTDVNKGPLEKLRIQVDRVNWFSHYRVHHRVASAFRGGRAFLAGDAAHIHSPVGGQGMNTGIGDAINLAWKLASVLRGRANPRLLDSYEAERMPFARRLVRTTDRAFEVVVSERELAKRARADVAPQLVAALLGWTRARKFIFETVSQIRIRYRRSPLSEGHAGAVHGGDRLPWAGGVNGADNFEPLASLNWQVHVYGTPAAELRRACELRRLPLHAFPFEAGAERAGLARDALYLVRPDGYVALAASAGVDRLDAYLEAHGVRPFDV
jgi:2-polyprenyl-6-methoxyphenol hydroxylase-like FAD-dependent oxidoreductase